MARSGGKWPGIGDRIALRMRDLGYWDSEQDRPDVRRFCNDHAANNYSVVQFYVWFADGVPDRQNLEYLAHDLKCDLAWLLLGRQALGVKAPPASPPLSPEARVWVAGGPGARTSLQKRKELLAQQRGAKAAAVRRLR